jgi:putative tributyrin esterase
VALIDCKFFSDVLGMCSSMVVILPESAENAIGLSGRKAARPEHGHRTLFLLHGLSDDETIWLRRTSIERYVAPLGLAVVMPNVHKSFYANMACGPRYWDFVSEELPRKARSFFPLSSRPEDNYVAGLSMGGYGALRLGLSMPHRFSHAASLSGLTDVMCASLGWGPGELEAVFGTKERATSLEHDPFALAEALAPSQRPRLFQCCGTEDFLYSCNVRFRDHLRRLHYDLTYEEGPGDHEWGYWDAMIQRVLRWLPAA